MTKLYMPRIKNDLARLARTAKAQLVRAEKLGKSLDYRQEQASELDPGWSPDDAWRRDFSEVSDTIAQCGATLAKAMDQNEKSLAKASTKQLEVQLKAELIRAAATFSEQEWMELDKIRFKEDMNLDNTRLRK